MLNETFYLDGIDSRSAGIQLQAPIEFSEAVPVVEAQTIPGRNGDLIFYTGSYENRSGEAECFCLQQDVEKAVSSAGRFLMGKKGYRRLETSDDPDHYWMARVENSPQIAMRLRTLSPFEIGFDCKPQRFVKAGENAVVFTANGSLFNQYGQVALPFITVYYKGDCSLTVGDCNVKIKGKWYNENYLDKEFQKYGITISQLKKNLYSVGVTEQEFWGALDNCAANGERFAENIWESTRKEATDKEISAAFVLTNAQYQSAFDAVMAGSWSNVIYLDSDTQNAYNEYGNQNLNINAPVFPVLGDGEIPIAFSGGIERVEIVPRWWEL